MNSRRPPVFLAFVFISVNIFAENVPNGYPDSLRAAACVERAIRSAATHRDSSFFWLNEAFALFKKNDDLRSWLKACKDTGVEFDYAGDPQTALLLYGWPLGEKSIRQPRTAAEWNTLGWLYADWGYTLAKSMGRYVEARVKYEEARRIFEEKANRLDVDVAAYVHRELGNICTRLGDHEAALLLLEQARRIALKSGDSNLAAEVSSDIALVYFDEGNTEQAIHISKEALGYQGLNEVSAGLLEHSLAIALVQQGNEQAAWPHIRRAKTAFEAVVRDTLHPAGKLWLSGTYKLMCQLSQEDADSERNFRESLRLLREYYPDTLRREFAKLKLTKADWYLQRHGYDRALRYEQAALSDVLYRFRETDLLTNPPADIFYPENTIMEALGGKAQSFEGLYEERHERQFLEKSIECHDLLFQAEQAYRQVHHFESSKLAVVAESSRRTESALDAAWRFFEDFEEKKALEQAFGFTEKSKSVLLYEALRQSGASSVANVPDSLLQSERQLKEKLAELEKQLFLERQKKAGNDAEKLEKMAGKMLALNTSLASLNQRMEQQFPTFFNLKYRQGTASVVETQRLLAPAQALLEYFVGDSSIFIFLVKKDGFHAERLPKDFPLEQWVADFRQGIEAFQFSGNNRDSLCEAYTDLAQQLYQRLVQPVEKFGLPQKLIVVPGGVLAFLPFDALLYEAPTAPCVFKKYPYLARRHNISYNYSSTLFKELMQGKKSTGGFAGFAPAFGQGNASGFGPLQFNLTSAGEAAQIWGGTAFIDGRASRHFFTENASKQRILYLATHAKANTDEGDFSFIVLAGESSGYDTLFVKDIYNLPIGADLVFLGACETGSGKFYNGEGVISLARSFLYAGARSIVTTLWSINDQSNKHLTVSFFKHLRDGERKDEALWHAKMEQLENSGSDLYAHPVFWAAYTPIGNMEPMGSAFPWHLVLTGGGLAGLAVLVFYRKKMASAKNPPERA